MTRNPILSPTLPIEGETIRLFGLSATVLYVEPHSDWAWDVTVQFAGDREEKTTVTVPTDYRTDDNLFSGDVTNSNYASRVTATHGRGDGGF